MGVRGHSEKGNSMKSNWEYEASVEAAVDSITKRLHDIAHMAEELVVHVSGCMLRDTEPLVAVRAETEKTLLGDLAEASELVYRLELAIVSTRNQLGYGIQGKAR